MKRSLSNQLFSKEQFSKRLRGSMTVEALYVFSLVFLSLTAATRRAVYPAFSWKRRPERPPAAMLALRPQHFKPKH